MSKEDIFEIINIVIPVVMVIANFISRVSYDDRPPIPEPSEPTARSDWMPKISKHPLIEMDRELKETVMLEEMWNTQEEVK